MSDDEDESATDMYTHRAKPPPAHKSRRVAYVPESDDPESVRNRKAENPVSDDVADDDDADSKRLRGRGCGRFCFCCCCVPSGAPSAAAAWCASAVRAAVQSFKPFDATR